MAEKRTPLVEKVAPNTIIMDVLDRNIIGKTAGFLLEGDELAIIDTGPGPSGELWLDLLAGKGYSPADVSYVIVTHVHLDHAGAAGYIMQKCKNAKAVVHPKGARFLVNPAPLLEGSRDFFADFDKTMLPVYPIAEERIIPVQDGETIECGNRKLTFIYGEGHSRNHFTVLDSMTNGIFCGDAAGLIYPELRQMKIDFCMPTAVTNQFDPVAYRLTLEQIRKMKPDIAFYTHFGAVDQPEAYFDICREMLDILVQAAEDTFSDKEEYYWKELIPVIEEKVRGYLVHKGFKKEQPLPFLLKKGSVILNSLGLANLWNRKKNGK